MVVWSWPVVAPSADRNTLNASRPPAQRLGAVLLVGAGALVAVTLLVARSQAPSGNVEPAALEVGAMPSTIPSVTSPAAPVSTPTDPGTTPRSVDDDEPAAATTLPRSPLADELPERVSALPSTPNVVEPVRIRIPQLDLTTPTRALGVEPDGQLEIPDETEVGWYRLGSSPGRPGATVLAAHVSWNDTIGPFFRLDELGPGAVVDVDLADGGSRRYEVVERAQYGKLALPAERIWTREGDETLVLITCGGEFNRSIRRYVDNIVVYAVPVESSAP